jgi:site-specific DNA-methyltransferase (adenine-specific)
METNRIYNMDCLEGMRALAGESVDCIVTDPPYKVTTRGGHKFLGGFFANELTDKGMIFEHNDIDIEQYLPEFYRVLKDGSHCYIMCNNSNLVHFFDAVRQSEFRFIKLLVWDKKTKIYGNYYMGQVEHIFLLRKGKDNPIRDLGQSDLLSFGNYREKNGDGSNIHDSQKPVSLFRILVRNATDPGDLVLDPFMGSGTAALACIKEGRNYLGYEIDPKYHELAERRVADDGKAPTLF